MPKTVQFWLLPGICVVCRKPSGREADLCVACHSTLNRIERPCLACALPLPPGDHAASLCGMCLIGPRLISRTVAACAYAEPVSRLIADYKYRAALQSGSVLGELLVERLLREYHTQALPQLVLPVPLHPARLRERGFNQALVLARQLGARLNIPVVPDALARIRRTPPQQGLSAKERKRNLRGAFRLQLDLDAFHSIALVDDVVTTASTAREIARVLRNQGAAEPELHVWCLARA